MKSRAIVSREYKALLRTTSFIGDETQLLARAGEFWRDFSAAVAPFVLGRDGALDTVETPRQIVFIDTDARHLHRSGYILRVRRTDDEKRPELTLKFRHPDRYIAESRQMKSRTVQAKIKFEEDIKVPFVSLYSYSARVKMDRKSLPTRLADVSRVFSDVGKRLADVDGRLPLKVVNGLWARERVIAGATLRVGTTPAVDLECALIVWHDGKRQAKQPIAVEFSYRYGNPRGQYRGKVAGRAFDIYNVLQTELKGWLDPSPRTKTSLAYD